MHQVTDQEGDGRAQPEVPERVPGDDPGSRQEARPGLVMVVYRINCVHNAMLNVKVRFPKKKCKFHDRK